MRLWHRWLLLGLRIGFIALWYIMFALAAVGLNEVHISSDGDNWGVILILWILLFQWFLIVIALSAAFLKKKKSLFILTGLMVILSVTFFGDIFHPELGNVTLSQSANNLLTLIFPCVLVVTAWYFPVLLGCHLGHQHHRLTVWIILPSMLSVISLLTPSGATRLFLLGDGHMIGAAKSKLVVNTYKLKERSHPYAVYSTRNPRIKTYDNEMVWDLQIKVSRYGWLYIPMDNDSWTEGA
ncbi:hypothetical protein [Lentilactobacillus hilgardii]|uniref:hypothetical protein n=1 Tax=Lentilactobacillus hilgardii TaxID=1588 RepID=UPI003FA5E5F8